MKTTKLKTTTMKTMLKEAVKDEGPVPTWVKIVIIIAFGFAIAITASRGAEAPVPIPPKTGPNKVVTKKQNESAFSAGEFTLSLYGTGEVSQKSGTKTSSGNEDPKSRTPGSTTRSYSKSDVDLGLGIAGDYYITKGLAIGGRAESGNADHSFFDKALGRGTFRAPLWDKVAPYGYVEGGYQFERERWLAGAGGGIELRLNKEWGAFVEAGLQTTTRSEAFGVGSAGVRFKF